MNSIKKVDAVSFTNGPTCKGSEYSFPDKDINVSVVIVQGRYPEVGYAMNEVCKEVGYVLRGTGSLGVFGKEVVQLQPGDAVMIQPGEKYYWQGEALELLMPCSPAFYPEQHAHVD